MLWKLSLVAVIYNISVFILITNIECPSSTWFNSCWIDVVGTTILLFFVAVFSAVMLGYYGRAYCEERGKE